MARRRVEHSLRLPIVPAGMFAVVIGLSGLSGNWQMASVLWGLPSQIGQIFDGLASAAYCVVMALFTAKWIFARGKAVEEAQHPVQGCLIGLLGVATMLTSRGLLPYLPRFAFLLFIVGTLFSIVFAIWRTGSIWHGGRDVADTTPALYLPTVAASLVCSLVLPSFGFEDWAQVAFGAGIFSWIAIESVLLQRLLTGPELAVALRPTLGLIFAPPAVGSASYLGLSAGPPDIFANAIFGYCALQMVLYLRLLPWIVRQPFTVSYWTCTLGTTSLATASMIMYERVGSVGAAALAPYLFVFANVVLGTVAVTTSLASFDTSLSTAERSEAASAGS